MIAKRYKTFNANDVRHEVEIMLRLSGRPNVVTLCGVFEDSDHVFLIMDFCSGGDLLDFIALQHSSGCSEQLVARVMLQVMSAIRSCHAAGVMHGDFKPENTMLCESDTNGPLLKLIDFGLSKIMQGEKMTAVVGTPCYMPLEVLQQNYGCESDIWSAGCIMYMLFIAEPPFDLEGVDMGSKGARRKQHRVYQTFKEEFPSSEACKSIPKSARDVLFKMLAVDPSTRLTANAFFEHPWTMQHMRLERVDAFPS